MLMNLLCIIGKVFWNLDLYNHFDKKKYTYTNFNLIIYYEHYYIIITKKL